MQHVNTLKQRIREAQAAVDAIQGGAPDYFPNSTADLALLVEFRGSAVEAKKDGSKYVDFDNDETGSTIFVGRGRTTSYAATTTSTQALTSPALLLRYVTTKVCRCQVSWTSPSIPVPMARPAPCLTQSSRSTHYKELIKTEARGTITVDIKGLPKPIP